MLAELHRDNAVRTQRSPVVQQPTPRGSQGSYSMPPPPPTPHYGGHNQWPPGGFNSQYYQQQMPPPMGPPAWNMPNAPPGWWQQWPPQMQGVQPPIMQQPVAHNPYGQPPPAIGRQSVSTTIHTCHDVHNLPY